MVKDGPVLVVQAFMEMDPFETKVWVELEIPGSEWELNHGIIDMLKEISEKRILREENDEKKME